MTLLIREPPPMRHDISVTTPSGARFRWGFDEPNPAYAPSGLSFSTVMPGGFDQANVTLPRKPDLEYSDLDRLSNVTIRLPGGAVVWDGRLEMAPKTSGDQMSVSPGLTGWQSHLDDNEAAQAIYVCQDASVWADSPLNEQIYLSTLGASQGDFSWSSQNGGLICQLPNQDLGPSTIAEIWFVSPAGIKVARIMYIGQDTSMPVGWEAPQLISATGDTTSGAGTDAMTLDNTLRSLTVSTPQRRVLVRVNSNGDEETPASGAQRVITAIGVYGDTGIPTQAIAGRPDGVLASDVIKHALATFCPLLTFDDESIPDSSFVIPHLLFTTLPNKASDIIKAAAQFELPDWAVWENRKVYVNERGARGTEWIGRVGPSQLTENGPQLAQLWNQVVVQYNDVDGTVRTVGPPGSGMDTEDASLVDPDPLNPANEADDPRVAVTQMGTSTPDGAIQVGGRFLQEQKLLNTSGAATHTGYVEDARGIIWPVSKMRGGDTVRYVDAGDTSPRRIVSTGYDDTSKGNQVQLDSPPDALGALLQEMGLKLIGTGLS